MGEFFGDLSLLGLKGGGGMFLDGGVAGLESEV